MRFVRLLVLALAAAVSFGSQAGGQTREAVRTGYKEPVFPESLNKRQKQGNVLIVGRIDAKGRITDLHAIAASHKDFVAPAMEAVTAWQFRPAMRDGKPIEIFANVGVRFRLEGDKRGAIGQAIIGDLAISPADASGKKTAPEGFPLRRGKDPALRAEVLLDIPPGSETRTLAVVVEAISPGGKHIPVFQPPVAVPANGMEVRIPVVAQIGAEWEEGVWMLRFSVDGKDAGGGQFWLASDPSHFSFVIPES